MRDGEINRPGSMMAFVTREKKTVTFYRLTGAAPALPEQCFSLGYAEGSYEAPTWSPAGDRIAFVDRAEDETGKILVADISGGCQTPAAGGKVTIANARHADWGPADAPEPAGAQPAPAKPGSGGGPSTSRRTLSLRGRKLARALRRGVVVKFRAPAAGRIGARALLGRRAVATGSATAARAGTVAVPLRFGARARRELRGRRSVRLTVRITFGGA